MSETQDKAPSQGAPATATSSSPRHLPYTQVPTIYQIQQPSAYTVGYPPMYPFIPPPIQDTNGQPTGEPNASATHYMMAFPPPPPGMIYAYPTAQAMPSPTQLPPALSRPKRKQVKLACTNCAQACKRCDEARPCQRCLKYNIQDTCVDGKRKERKKGVKRGPYKRKGKPADEDYEGVEVSVDQSPQGFYQPYFYPPPGFIAVGPDGQPLQTDPSNASGVPQGQGGSSSPQPQYYQLQPYPPFAFTQPHGGAAPYPMFPGHMVPPGIVTDPQNGTGGNATGVGRGEGSSGSTDGEGSPASPTMGVPMTPPVSAAEETHPSNGRSEVNSGGKSDQSQGKGKKRKGVVARNGEADKDGQAPAQKKLSTVARRTPSPIRPTQGVSYLNKSSDVNNTDDRGPATSLDRPMTPPSASD